MKLEKTNSKSAEHCLIAIIKDRLSINNIFRQFELIINMTRNLDIKFKIFAKFEPIKHLSREQVLRVIKHVPFLTYFKAKRGEHQEEYINIKYENSSKVLLVTGMTKQAIEEMLKHFDNFGTNIHHKRTSAKIIANNGFWVTIETNSEQHAANLKKYIRGKKKINDQNNTSYKVEGRRIRIVILKEDFLSILIDAMTQIKSELFQKHFQLPNPTVIERRKSQDETVLNAELRKKSIIYRPIIMNTYYPKNELQEKELSDGFSESNSLSSDILDSNKIKDLIQTSEQGIQSENNGDFAQSSVENISEKENQSNNSQSKIVNEIERELPSVDMLETEQIVTKTQAIKEEEKQLIIQQEQHPLVSPNKKEEKSQSSYQQPFHSKTPITTKINEDDPFISTEMFVAPQNNSPTSAAIQTQETFLSSIPYSLMKRFLQEFKQMRNTSQLIELPEWIKSESQEQRNRHRFFDSLCRPKIIQKRPTFQ